MEKAKSKLSIEKLDEQIYNYSIKYPTKTTKDIADFFDVSLGNVRKAMNVFYRKFNNKKHDDIFEKAYKIIEEYDGVPKIMLLTKSRKKEVVSARRHFCALVCNEKTGISLEKTGAQIHLDHSTVIHHLRTNDDYCDIEPEYKSHFSKMWTDMFGSFTDAEFSFWLKEDKYFIFFYKATNGKFYKKVSEVLEISNKFILEESIEVYWDEVVKSFKSANNSNYLPN